jgi:ParB family chromosome partitioning protein
MTKPRGLGRGLGALIPTAAPELADIRVEPAGDGRTGPSGPQDTLPAEPSDRTGPKFLEIPVAAVSPNPRQPRQVFDDDALAELVHSIAEIGLLQPIVVRPVGTGFELVAGERRLRAAKAAGMSQIPAFVRRTQDEEMLRDALLENLHRAALNPLEEAAAYEQLLVDFACTQDELAQRVGRSRSQVTNTLRLLKLPLPVQRRVAAGVLSAGHARALLGLSDVEEMERLAGRIVAEGLSVRAVEELVLLSSTDTPKPRRRAKRRETPVEYETAAERLSDRLDTRVRIEAGSRKGRIIVEFAAVDDLARIVDLMESGRAQ